MAAKAVFKGLKKKRQREDKEKMKERDEISHRTLMMVQILKGAGEKISDSLLISVHVLSQGHFGKFVIIQSLSC